MLKTFNIIFIPHSPYYKSHFAMFKIHDFGVSGGQWWNEVLIKDG